MTNNKQQQVSLALVAQGNEQEVKLFMELVHAQGWCFVAHDTHLMNLAQCVREQFLQTQIPESCNGKFGYYYKKQKQGLRLITGPYLSQFVTSPMVQELCNELDTLACQMQQVCFPNVEGLAEPRAGMLDIVTYNEGAFVAEHGDPGLFAISFGSNTSDLCMYDPNGKEWINVPPNQAVLWCGATSEHVGMHKVNTVTEKRTTLWYELCAFDQIPTKPLVNYIGRLQGGVPVVVITLTGKKINIDVDPTATGDAIFQQVEQKEGIPFSKMRIIVRHGSKIVQLREETPLSSFDLTSGTTFYLALSLK